MIPQLTGGQPFDVERKRRELLQRLQDNSLMTLRTLGAVPMTSGVTRALPAPETGEGVLATLSQEIARGAATEGPRYLDRHSTDASSSYRNTRYRYFASNYGANPYAFDDTTGRRVAAGGVKPTGHTRVGINFDMDAPDAKATWDGVFGGSVSFDDVKGGKASLSSDQIQALFDTTILKSEADLSKAAGPSILSENQRLALLSATFDTPNLIKEIAPYLQAGDGPSVGLVLLDDGKRQGVDVAARRYMQASQYAGTAARDYIPDYKTYRSGGNMTEEMRSQIIRVANSRGISPVDLATAISYETIGSFDPRKPGPVTQWGRHIGLIQMGGPQRAKYGYDPNGSLSSQMDAVGRYLDDTGVKPGMGLMDIYSAINAGRVGRYNASDANNGGAPGTVADKVNNQMALHRKRAMAFILGQ